LIISGFSPQITGETSGTFTVTALDAEGERLEDYRGTVYFSSSDPSAQLPPVYTFTSRDEGRHTFTATLNTFGVQSITASDLAARVRGTRSGIQVVPTPPVVTGGTTITATAGKTFGVAAGFDGTDDYIQVPSSLVVGGAVTVEAWVKSANVLAPWARVIDFSNGPNQDNIILGWQGGSGHLYWATYRNGQTIQFVSPQVFPQNPWQPE